MSHDALAVRLRGRKTPKTWFGLEVVLLASLLAVGSAGSASSASWAECTDLVASRAVRDSLAVSVGCYSALLAGEPDPDCDALPPPVCAGTLVEDALELAFGRSAAPELAADPELDGQLGCQQAIGAAALELVNRRLRRRVLGASPEEADLEVSPALDRLALDCDLDVAVDGAGTILPRVGPQCTAAVGDADSTVDPAALSGCLRGLLSLWVDRVAPDPQPLRPNIVLIVADDMRFDSFGATHALPGTEAVMPQLVERIADEGLVLERAFVNHAACDPSRAGLLSGQASHRSGVSENDKFKTFDDTNTLAVWLDEAGYRTGLVGKYLNGYSRALREDPFTPAGWIEWFVAYTGRFFDFRMFDNGADVWFGTAEEDYSTDVLAERALEFLAEAAPGEPFFLMLSTLAPHNPAIPAPRHVGSMSALAPWRPESWNEPDVSDKPAYIAGLASHSQTWQDDMDQLRIDMLESLLAVDDAVAAIMDALDEQGITDDTVVMFTSDNGLFWGEHRLTGKKWPYEEAARVPLLVRYPALVPLPRTDATLVTNLDVTATVVELAGAEAGRELDGTSLVQVLDGTDAEPRERILLESKTKIPHAWSAAVREADWKYVEHSSLEYELYDLAGDPLELENLADLPEHAEREARMALDLRQLRPGWIDEDGDRAPDDVDVCPGVYDPNQFDANDNGIGNACQGEGGHCGLGLEAGLALVALYLTRAAGRRRRTRRAS